MKHQISKVALIATLAFIGFAGTQQAKAGGCEDKKDICSYDGLDVCRSRAVPAPYNTKDSRVVSSPTTFPTGSQSEDGGCRDCHGDCRPNPVTFRVNYYRCDLFDIDKGEVVSEGYSAPVYIKTVESEGSEADCAARTA